MEHSRNTTGLKNHANKKREETFKKVDIAIKTLLKNEEPINFKSVSREANVTTSWLYKEEEIKERVEQLRNQQNPKKKKKSFNGKEQEIIASQDAIIKTLKQRIKEQNAKIAQLEQKVQIAYSHFQESD